MSWHFHAAERSSGTNTIKSKQILDVWLIYGYDSSPPNLGTDQQWVFKWEKPR